MTTKITNDNITSMDAGKLTGALPGGMSTDMTPIENDLAILALQNAVNSNISAHGLQNSWIEQFEDSGSITGLTNCSRVTSGEYVASVYSVNGAFTSDANTKLLMHMDDSALTTDSGNTGHTITNTSVTRSSTKSKYGGYSAYFNGSSNLTAPNHPDWSFGTGDMTIEFWFFPESSSHGGMFDLNKYSTQLPVINVASWGLNMQHYGSTVVTNVNDSIWHHVASVRDSNVLRAYVDGVQIESDAYSSSQASTNGIIVGNYYNGGYPYTGYIDELRVSNVARYPNGTTFTPNTVASSNATASFTSTTITPQDSASKSSLGLVILYKNNAGTNTLNTDVICKVSADNGSNYSTCVLASKGTFSTGINIAIAPAIAVTAGTQLKYKVEFANQASGSKEAQIHGVALQY